MINQIEALKLSNLYRKKVSLKNVFYENKRIKFIEKNIFKSIKRGLYFSYIKVKGTHFLGLKEHFVNLGYDVEIVTDKDKDYNFVISWYKK